MKKSNYYVKRPIPVKVYDFLETKVDDDNMPLYDEEVDGKFFIHTLEGRQLISPDDMVIEGIEGERYPCKRRIFDKTYVLVKD